MFTKATKRKLKARIAIEGPTGSGKTFTALRFAHYLAGRSAEGGGGRIAVVDTEHRSASKYAGESPDGVPWSFDVADLVHFAPSTYSTAVKAATGYDVLIVDSLSHAWEGLGGALDQVDRKAASTKGGSYAAWRDVTPQHREMIEALLSFPGHLIVTMRSKMAHEMTTNEKGKIVVEKVGLKPIQREGVEYEFDVVADLDVEHLMTISKSRCSAIDGLRVVKPGGGCLTPFVAWLNAGTEEPPPPAFTPPMPAAAEATATTAVPVPPPPPGLVEGAEPPATTKPAGVKIAGDSSGQAVASDSDLCDAGQRERLVELVKAAGMDAADIKAAIGRRGKQTLAQLTRGEIGELTAKIDAAKSRAETPF